MLWVLTDTEWSDTEWSCDISTRSNTVLMVHVIETLDHVCCEAVEETTLGLPSPQNNSYTDHKRNNFSFSVYSYS